MSIESAFSDELLKLGALIDQFKDPGEEIRDLVKELQGQHEQIGSLRKRISEMQIQRIRALKEKVKQSEMAAAHASASAGRKMRVIGGLGALGALGAYAVGRKRRKSDVSRSVR